MYEILRYSFEKPHWDEEVGGFCFAMNAWLILLTSIQHVFDTTILSYKFVYFKFVRLLQQML